MANNPNPVARARISIGSATDAFTEAALAADTYTQIKHVRSVPGFGDSFQDITVEEVDDPRTRHAKGTANGATMEIVCTRKDTDPGQIKAIAASKSYQSFNLKIELPTADGDFDVSYHSVLVMSANTGNGGPNDTQTRTFSCQPQEAPIEVPAA
ncbi:hypothetical protein [Aureimonas ureilytica]|uniref:hypothetical protein n=2 Tax=Aureimonas ureilytica TaxID=401562 RepID=UPI000761B11D|nr:hypothetical protein [Aureimonas ureilytica]